MCDFLKFMMGGGFLIFYLYKFFVMNDNCCFFMILYDFNLLVYLSKKVLFIVQDIGYLFKNMGYLENRR